MTRTSFLVCLAAAVILASASGVLAQGTQTAILVGTVTSPDGTPLPGVTVTATSPALMGERQAITAANGDYTIRGLPPGEYTVRFGLSGMDTITRTIPLGLGVNTRVDAAMRMSTATEVITVTGTTTSVLETPTVGTNITREVVERLPAVRTPVQIGALAAGVTGGDRDNRTPVAGQLSISGGMAYDNNFMINGVNVQDPIFGTTNNLFIEDAIQETQVLTSGISAEYGHFTGGVLNVITRSGGNEFSGSLRGDLTKPEWRDETPFEKGFRGDGVARATPTKRSGDLGTVYSATLGGPILRDRIWFFGAIRDQEDSTQPALPVTGINVARVISNRRWEGKLTGNIGSSHSIQGNYVENPVNATHEIQVTPLEMAAIGLNSTRINEGFSVSYTGVLTSNFFAEARYSEKKFGFRGLGGTSTDIVDSPIRSLAFHQSLWNTVAGTYNAPYFDATDPEDRNNDAIFGALSYFLTTGRAGSHDLKVGAESFTVTRTGGNSQSATSYVFYTPYLIQNNTHVLENGRLVPRFVPVGPAAGGGVGRGTGETLIAWWVPTRGAQLDVTTNSIFLQDRWDISPRWTASLGVRHEMVGSDVTGAEVVELETTTTVPRLALSFDPLANGRFKFDVTYGEYAGRYNPGIVAGNSPVGNTARLYGYYVGPAGTGRNFAPGFNPANYTFYSAVVPTANVFIDENLSSPVQREITLSAGTALPRSGWLKATYVDREMRDFIEDFITIDNGTTDVVFQGVRAGIFDNIFYRNTNGPQREYQALQLQSRMNILRSWMIEGNYTRQLRNHGNFEGEAGQSLPASTFGNRPEIQSPRNNPTGRLSQYQADKLRLWTTYNFNLGMLGNLGAGIIYRYDSPLTFSYTTTANITAAQRARQPNYRSYPAQTVFYGERGAGEYNATSMFDLSLQWGLRVFRSVEPWIKVDVANMLNSDTLRTFQTPIVACSPTSTVCQAPLDSDGLPTDFRPGAAFGRPSGTASYVVPREIFVSAGIRF